MAKRRYTILLAERRIVFQVACQPSYGVVVNCRDASSMQYFFPEALQKTYDQQNNLEAEFLLFEACCHIMNQWLQVFMLEAHRSGVTGGSKNCINSRMKLPKMREIFNREERDCSVLPVSHGLK